MTGTRHDRREWLHRSPSVEEYDDAVIPRKHMTAHGWSISDWSGCYSHRAMHTISLYYLDDRSIFSRWRNRMINLVWTLGGLQDKCCTVQVVRSMPYSTHNINSWAVSVCPVCGHTDAYLLWKFDTQTLSYGCVFRWHHNRRPSLALISTCKHIEHVHGNTSASARGRETAKTQVFYMAQHFDRWWPYQLFKSPVQSTICLKGE